MERGLILRQHLFGSNSDELWKACSVVADKCNFFAMHYMDVRNNNFVLDILKKAVYLTERDPCGRATSYNNLACFYRLKGKLHKSLSFLQKAIKIESALDKHDAADTYLNACAVLSQLGRHQMALQHAQNALIMLQDEMVQSLGPQILSNVQTSKPQTNEQNNSPEKTQSTLMSMRLDRLVVICIAHYNIAVEYSFLKQQNLSLESYTKGAGIAEKYLGNDHSMTKTLKQSKKQMEDAMKSKDRS